MELTSKRIPSLDGLRTISILLVIIGHLFQVFHVAVFAHLGNLGVRVFFVISGFLITGLLLKEIEKNSKINILKFYFRRTLRIFPPFYFYILVIFLAALFGFFEIAPKSFLVASFYLSNYISTSTWLLGHSWSLAVEEQFYLFFPGILLLLGIKKTKMFLVFLVLISPFIRVFDYRIFGSEVIWIDKGFHSNMDALAIGCLLSLFYVQLHDNKFYKNFLTSKLVIFLPVLIFLFNSQDDHPHFFFGVSILAMNLLIVLCIDWAVTNHDSYFGKILNSAPMIMLGMMSYSIYLWQQPLFINIENSDALIRFPFNLIGLIMLTIISYCVVEKYSLKLRQYLEKKFFDKKSVPTENLSYLT